jgi:L-arabinose isomerase
MVWCAHPTCRTCRRPRRLASGPDFRTSSPCWFAAGAAPHTVTSAAVGIDVFRDFAESAQTELLVIDESTTARA